MSRASLAAWVLGSASVLFVGCNAVLGIHETLSDEWDGGAALSGASTMSNSSVSVSQTSYSNSLSAGDGAIPAPIDAGVVVRWAAWPIPNPPSVALPHPQVYDTTTTPGIVRDEVTYLQWQASSDGAFRDWNDAVNYCNSLATAGGGWRLPSRIELFSILDYTEQPWINSTSFGSLPDASPSDSHWPGDKFWTASLLAGNDRQAWVVDFTGGTDVDLVFPQPLSTKYLVRCVRGGS
jgi:hypothetical protein